MRPRGRPPTPSARSSAITARASGSRSVERKTVRASTGDSAINATLLKQAPGVLRSDIEARAQRLKGGRVAFERITVTGTEDLLMAATLAEGETIMQNCACEPEVADLADLLNKMGAHIEGAGTSTIRGTITYAGSDPILCQQIVQGGARAHSDPPG